MWINRSSVRAALIMDWNDEQVDKYLERVFGTSSEIKLSEFVTTSFLDFNVNAAYMKTLRDLSCLRSQIKEMGGDPSC